MNEVSFTEATELDVPELIQILSDATRYKVGHEDMAWGNTEWSEKEVHDYMCESTVYIAKQFNQVIGSVSLQWNDERNWGPQRTPAGYMHRMAIKNGFHGQGHGKHIIDWVSEQVLKNGYRILRLDCSVSNKGLCAYYEQLGFKQVGTRPVLEYKNYIAALYERSVKPAV